MATFYIDGRNIDREKCDESRIRNGSGGSGTRLAASLTDAFDQFPSKGNQRNEFPKQADIR